MAIYNIKVSNLYTDMIPQIWSIKFPPVKFAVINMRGKFHMLYISSKMTSIIINILFFIFLYNFSLIIQFSDNIIP